LWSTTPSCNSNYIKPYILAINVKTTSSSAATLKEEMLNLPVIRDGEAEVIA
jgi:hypothetical protein